ncbi:MAG: 3-oxoacyl-[acyl-carrier-protein] synthase 3 [Gammaproteobacteria bacterium]|nr:MAG: 3-oxoacyl-[acyl-carrier-protein] synthase 3 [Gammaproteobacteria bacterium]
MPYTRITGTGSYLPERVLTNHDLEKFVDTSDAWIRERTGIRARHIAADGETVADMAEAALRQALDAAGRRPQDLDLIVVATCTAEARFPAVAAQLQQRLGVAGFAAVDVNAACSGFIYALSLVDALIRQGAHRCVAVIGAEKMSSLIDWSDRSTCVLFGDGAGAVIAEPAEQPGVLSTHIHADGTQGELLHHRPDTGHIVMEGNKVFRLAVKTLERIVDETLEANGLDKSAVDWLIPHQANLRIMLATAQKLALPEERVIVTVDEHGNTSAASIPLAFDHGVRSGRIRRGELLLMESFGAGFTWGSALLRY